MSVGWVWFLGVVAYLVVGALLVGVLDDDCGGKPDSDDVGILVVAFFLWPLLGAYSVGQKLKRRLKRVEIPEATAREKQS